MGGGYFDGSAFAPDTGLATDLGSSDLGSTTDPNAWSGPLDQSAADYSGFGAGDTGPTSDLNTVLGDSTSGQPGVDATVIPDTSTSTAAPSGSGGGGILSTIGDFLGSVGSEVGGALAGLATGVADVGGSLLSAAAPAIGKALPGLLGSLAGRGSMTGAPRVPSAGGYGTGATSRRRVAALAPLVSRARFRGRAVGGGPITPATGLPSSGSSFLGPVDFSTTGGLGNLFAADQGTARAGYSEAGFIGKHIPYGAIGDAILSGGKKAVGAVDNLISLFAGGGQAAPTPAVSTGVMGGGLSSSGVRMFGGIIVGQDGRFYRSAGRPLLWSGDVAACKRVRKARKYVGAAGGHRRMGHSRRRYR